MKVVHVYREANRATDWLANKGVAQENRMSFIDLVPIGLARILDEDIHAY